MNRNFTAFCAAMFACALLFAFCAAMISNNSVFSLADTHENNIKTVYLTFDDGPSDRVTPKILDVLKEENVKATFFIVGKHAEQRKYLVKRIYDEGHTLGIHSYSHIYGEIYKSEKNLIEDINKCNELIKEVTGEYSKIYRFPGGSFGLKENLIQAVTDCGLRYIDWNASTRDAEILDASPDTLYKYALSTASNSNNVVLLAHDSTTKTATAEALKSIIKEFKKRGYSFSKF